MSTADDLRRKKRVRAGHRGSATKAIERAEDLLTLEKPDIDRLSQVKLMLSEKLEVLKTLDAVILDLVEESDMAEEIDQADEFKEKMYAAMVRNDRVLNSTYDAIVRPMTTATSSTPSSGGSSRVRRSSFELPLFSSVETLYHITSSVVLPG